MYISPINLYKAQNFTAKKKNNGEEPKMTFSYDGGGYYYPNTPTKKTTGDRRVSTGKPRRKPANERPKTEQTQPQNPYYDPGYSYYGDERGWLDRNDG